MNGRSAGFFNCVLTAGILLGCVLSSSVRADTTIIIVRHGEKPPRGLGQLSCKGLNRSLALASALLSHYGKPVAIYAPNPAIKKIDKRVPYAYIRPLSTIEPLAIRAGLPVNIDWGMADITDLEKALLARTEGLQVVAWEHHFAEKLARNLLAASGGNPADVPHWSDWDFDSIYIVRVTGRGKDKRVSFAHENEGLNGVSDNCGE